MTDASVYKVAFRPVYACAAVAMINIAINMDVIFIPASSVLVAAGVSARGFVLHCGGLGPPYCTVLTSTHAVHMSKTTITTVLGHAWL